MGKPLPTNIPRTTRTTVTPFGTVKYRAWSLGCQSILLQAMPDEGEEEDIEARNDAITQVLEDCIVSWDGGKVGDMPLFLAELMFIKIRAISNGEEASVARKCSKEGCNGSTVFNFNMDEIELVVPEDHKSEINVGEFVFKLDYPTLRSAFDVSKMSKDNFTEELAAQFIKKISTEDEVWNFKTDYSHSEQLSFVRTLGSEIQTAIIEKFVKTMPFTQLKLYGKCNKCGEPEELVIKGVTKLFQL